MEEAAYNFDLFSQTQTDTATQQAQATHTYQKTKESQTPFSSVQGGRASYTPRQIALCAAGLILVCVLLVLNIQDHAKITELTKRTNTAQAQLLVEQTNYTYLNNKLSAETSMAQVEKYAKEHGMVKQDESQVTYIRIENAAVIETTKTTWQLALQAVKDGAQSIVEFLNP